MRKDDVFSKNGICFWQELFLHCVKFVLENINTNVLEERNWTIRVLVIEKKKKHTLI